MQAPEVSGEPVGEVRVVDDMHQRKALMAAKADAFLCLPGGYGTLEVKLFTDFRLSTNRKVVSYSSRCRLCIYFLPSSSIASIWVPMIEVYRLAVPCSLDVRHTIVFLYFNVTGIALPTQRTVFPAIDRNRRKVLRC